MDTNNSQNNGAQRQEAVVYHTAQAEQSVNQNHLFQLRGMQYIRIPESWLDTVSIDGQLTGSQSAQSHLQLHSADNVCAIGIGMGMVPDKPYAGNREVIMGQSTIHHSTGFTTGRPLNHTALPAAALLDTRFACIDIWPQGYLFHD